MKVLLLKDVKSLGKAGEIKDVKDGYGQNFIINKGYGKLATPNVVRQYEAKEKQALEEEKEQIKQAQELAKKLEKISIKVSKKLGANGSLFGALKKEDISEELAKKGFEIDKKNIDLDSNIKATGSYEAKIKLGFGVFCSVNVEVEGE